MHELESARGLASSDFSAVQFVDFHKVIDNVWFLGRVGRRDPPPTGAASHSTARGRVSPRVASARTRRERTRSSFTPVPSARSSTVKNWRFVTIHGRLPREFVSWRWNIRRTDFAPFSNGARFFRMNNFINVLTFRGCASDVIKLSWCVVCNEICLCCYAVIMPHWCLSTLICL